MRSKGFTLIEVMISLVVMAILLAGLVQFSSGIMKQTNKMLAMRTEDREISNVIERVVQNFSSQQIAFDSVNPLLINDPILDESKLPLAWNAQKIAQVSECPECRGRLGVVARPHPSLNGLYVVRMVIRHPDLFEGVKDFKFLATMK